MTPEGSGSERWRQIEAICVDALELEGEARARYLASACGGDEPLRREVEALLARDTGASGFLSQPVDAMAAALLGDRDADLVGRRLGDYDITGKLGAGGMGVVYRARDRQLGRDVAIKVLPPELAADPDRLARFRREAKLVAVASHPNIGVVYGLIESPAGAAIVLELIDGQPLSSLLGNGPLRPTQALTIASQIADALDHVHKRGVVHRDIKPSNILLSSNGQAKLVDFGVGKWSGPFADRPTSVSAQTAEGALVGTLNYMAPEQLAGGVADARADLFALGAVLFEMIAGRRAFDGPSQASVIAAVMESQPPSLSAVQSGVPAELARVVSKALAKDPDERWQTARDFADELRWLAARETVAPVAAPPARPPLMIGAAALAVVGLVAAAIIAWPRATPSTAHDLLSATIEPPPNLEIDAYSFDVSPDGRQVVFRGFGSDGSSQFYRRNIARFDSVAIPGTDGACCVAFAPDGQSIAFMKNRQLWRMQLDGGGTPQPVTELAFGSFNTAWSGNEMVLFTGRHLPINRVPASGGLPVAVTTINASTEVDHHTPFDAGQNVLLSGVHGKRDRFSIAAAVNGTSTAVVESGFAPRVTHSGHLIFGRGFAILGAVWDARTRTISGDPMTLIAGVSGDIKSGETYYCVSASGTLVYAPHYHPARRQLVWVTREGVEAALPIPPAAFDDLRISPDGGHILFSTADANAKRTIWEYALADGRMSPPLTNDADGYAAIWNLDGSAIAFAVDAGDATRVLLQPLNGGAAATATQSADNKLFPNSFAPDGSLLIVESPPTEEFFISRVMRGETRLKPFVEGAGFPRAARVSPDGRWLAFDAIRGGRSQVFVQPYPAGGPWRQISIDGGTQPIWSRDGRTLYYRRGQEVNAVSVVAGPTFTWKAPVRLFVRDYVRSRADYDVAADGRFLMIKPDPNERASTQLRFVINWVDDVAKRLPRRP